jgi:hypothetical protein
MHILLAYTQCDESCPASDKCDEEYSRSCGVVLNVSERTFPIFKKLLASLDSIYNTNYTNNDTFILNEKFIKSFNINNEIVAAAAVDDEELVTTLRDLKSYFKRARTLKRPIALSFDLESYESSNRNGCMPYNES